MKPITVQVPSERKAPVTLCGLLYVLGPSLLTWWMVWMVFEKVIRGWAQ